jgi:hypothetical protein
VHFVIISPLSFRAENNPDQDPNEGRRYLELTKRKEIDNLYNMIAQMDDYVNPTTGGVLSWRSIFSCTSYSEEALDNWQ